MNNAAMMSYSIWGSTYSNFGC